MRPRSKDWLQQRVSGTTRRSVRSLLRGRSEVGIQGRGCDLVKLSESWRIVASHKTIVNRKLAQSGIRPAVKDTSPTVAFSLPLLVLLTGRYYGDGKSDPLESRSHTPDHTRADGSAELLEADQFFVFPSARVASMARRVVLLVAQMIGHLGLQGPLQFDTA
jgi:hypothetical protein